MEAPIVCREQHCVYAWQPLSGDAAIEPAQNAICIESSSVDDEARDERTQPVTPRSTMSDRVRGNGEEHSIKPGVNGHSAGESPGTSLVALIKDAEALHTTLTEARSGLARLITGLRGIASSPGSSPTRSSPSASSG